MRHRLLLLFAIFFIGFGTASSLGFMALPSRVSSSVVGKSHTRVAQPTTAQDRVYVLRVIDGDTIELADGTRVRYIGIDTPETVNPKKPVECYGPEASLENKQLVEGKYVRLEKDISQVDSFGRLLRYVYVDDVMVNEKMVRDGFAHASTYPPDVAYQERFRQAEVQARDNGRGLWSACSSIVNPTPLLPQNAGFAGQANAPDIQGATTQSGCTIKGNISANGDKIYHVQGCDSYEQTSIDAARGERWFCTEDEAKNAGWRKAKNC